MLVNVALLLPQTSMAGRGIDIKLGEGVRELEDFVLLAQKVKPSYR